MVKYGGGRGGGATDRKRVIELSQHCFCSAPIKLCWRVTDRLRAPMENSRELLIKLQSAVRETAHQLGMFLKKVQSCHSAVSQLFSWLSQTPPKKVKTAGSSSRASHFRSHCRTCEETSTSRCFSMTQHFDTVTDQTGNVGDGLRFSDLQVQENKQQTHKHTHKHTHTGLQS